MTEKVKITQEQADAIESEVKNPDIESIVKCHIEGWKYGNNKCLNELSLDEFLHALYIGYEVEPEINDGDFLLHIPMNVIGKVINGVVHWSDNVQNDIEFTKMLMNDGEVRHATPEEIAKEKERDWWAKHGRNPWELKAEDTLANMQYKKDLLVISRVTKGTIVGYSSMTEEYEHLSISDVKTNFEVFCFAEDRKDVDHG